VVEMGRYVTVSVKIPTELREKMRKLGIRPSALLRRAIEEEVRRLEAERVKRKIEELKPILDRITMEDVVQAIREDREGR